MNHALSKLTSDLQDVMRKSRETLVLDTASVASLRIPPYEPSEIVKNFEEEQVKYNQQVANIRGFLFNELR